MPSNWTKQPQQINNTGGTKLNDGSGDSVVGGLMTGVPAGLNFSQGNQSLPGDRMVLGEEDAAALTDTTIGVLYGGMYQYVKSKSGTTATPTRTRAMFWDPAAAGSAFQVTPDEGSSSINCNYFAGVNIITMTKGNAWWIQTAGRVLVQFKASLTGTAADGEAVYLAAAGAGSDVATFDVLNGSGNPTFTQMGTALNLYVGPAQGIPVAGGQATTINLPLGRMYRW